MRYSTKYVGGPLDGQVWVTDNLEDFGTTWSISDWQMHDGELGRYYHTATRSNTTGDSIWRTKAQEEEWARRNLSRGQNGQQG